MSTTGRRHSASGQCAYLDLTRRGKRVAVLLSAEAYDRLKQPCPDARRMLVTLAAWRARLSADFVGFWAEEARAWRSIYSRHGFRTIAPVSAALV